MDSRTFLGLEPTHNRFRWKLPVTKGVSVGAGFLFGGCGLAAAIAAIEGTSGRNCVWATGQYLSYAAPGEVADIDVIIAAEGHQITQARAIVHVADREILTVNAALGDRDGEADAQFEQMPDDLPSPMALQRRPVAADQVGTITERLDQRIVKGREWLQLATDPEAAVPSDGHMMMWARIPEQLTDADAVTLAILGDFVPMGVGQAVGRRGGGNSLDNTLRVYRTVPTDWVLVDIKVHGVQRGFGHGRVHMFGQDGTLLATASQSVIARFVAPD